MLLSAAKIQNFVETINDRDGFTHPEIINIIDKHKDTVQDKGEKIAAAVTIILSSQFHTLGKPLFQDDECFW